MITTKDIAQSIMITVDHETKRADTGKRVILRAGLGGFLMDCNETLALCSFQDHTVSFLVPLEKIAIKETA